MAVSLEWTFEKDFAKFIHNQNVKLSREQIENDHYLICQSQQTRSTPGVKLTDIMLPNNGREYFIEIDGFANNNKAFIWVVDNDSKKRLIKDYVYLPELVASTQRIEPTKASFKLRGAGGSNGFNGGFSSSFINAGSGSDIKEYSTVSIGVLFGGSQPSTSDIFFIKRVRLYDSSVKQSNAKSGEGAGYNSNIQITRVYENLEELECDLPNPSRDNKTKMQEGEYAIIKQSGTNGANGDHGKLFVVYADPDLGSANNLKYVCNITGRDNILTKSLFLDENQMIPIYDDQWKAYEDVKNKETAKDFYNPQAKDKTGRVGGVSKKDGKIYLYFDKEGYIRWMNSRRLKPKKPGETAEAEDEVSISVSQPLVDRLKKLGTNKNLIDFNQALEQTVEQVSEQQIDQKIAETDKIDKQIAREDTTHKPNNSILENTNASASGTGTTLQDGTGSQDDDTYVPLRSASPNLAKDSSMSISQLDITTTQIDDVSASYRTKTRNYILGKYDKINQVN